MILIITFNINSQNREPLQSIQNDEDLISRGTNYFNSHEYGEAINSFLEAANQGEKENDSSLSCLAYYNLGVVYFNISEIGEAIANFQKAYEICKKNNLGPIREVEILSGIAGVWFNNEKYDKSKEILQDALKIAKANNDSSMLGHIWENLALISNKTNDLDTTILYLNEAKKYINGDNFLAVRIKEIEADRNRLAGDYENAYLILNDLVTNGSINDDNIYVSYLDILRQTKRYEEAIELQTRIEGNISLPYKANFYNQLSQIYADIGFYNKALAFKDSVVFFMDMISKIDNRKLIENSNLRLDLLKYQMESDKKVVEAESKARLWIIISLVFFFLLVVSAMTLTYMRYKAKNKQQLLNLKLEKEQNEKRIAQEKMEEIEKFAKYRQEMLKKDIEQKNRELEAHLMFMNSRNDLLENLTDHINKDVELTNIPAVTKLLQYIKRLQNNNEKDKDNFLLNHEAADPEFTGKLLNKHPELLQSDIKFLGYIRMNLNSKEISSILNITPDSCKRRKIRISKKLNLESSSDLYSYLINL